MRVSALLKTGEMITRPLVSVLLVLLFSTLLRAQTEAQQRGNCDLAVSVRAADEASIDVPIQVDLLAAQGWIATAHITGAEPAQFRVINGKSYRLKVSGRGFETVTTPYFEVNPLETLHTETVHVKPESLESAAQPASGPPTISVAEMGIPKKAGAEMNKGLDAYSKGDMRQASAHFEKAIAEYPRYARAYDMLGAIAIKRSNRSKARELFSKSIRVDSAFLPAYLDLVRMDLQDKNYAASQTLLAKVIAMNPLLPDAVALLATTEFASKDYAKALADVQRTHALPNHEQFAEVHIMAGKVLVAQHHPAAAIEQFQLFLQEKPDSPLAPIIRKQLASLEATQHQLRQH